MRGDFYDGWLVLAGQFPPTLNKENDPTRLQVFESPDCYGVDYAQEDRLKTGSIAAGTTRTAPIKTISATTYNWYYNRVWRASTADLIYGAPELDDVFLPQDLGIFEAKASIVTFMPALSNAMWVVTATGSHLIPNVTDPRSFFNMHKFSQEMFASTATHALTLDGIPFAANAAGIFSWDGNKTKEWTRNIRNNLGSFVGVAIKANYALKLIVGTAKFVIDTETGKLFDYGTSGFRFTSRTLSQPSPAKAYSPFTFDRLAFVLEQSNESGGTIKWETKVEENDWFEENDIEVEFEPGEKTRIEVPINNSSSGGRQFRMRVTSLTSTVYIREIQINVGGLAQEASTE